jgi:cytochrome P450
MSGPEEIDERYRGFEVDEKYRHVTAPVTRFRHHNASWLIAGYTELVAALRDDATFSSAHDLPTGTTARIGVMTPPTAIRAVPTEVDPPDYYFYRRLLGPWFSPAAVRALRPEITTYTAWCIDRYIECGRMDLFHELIELVPALTTMRLLGLPLADSRIVAQAVHARGNDRFDLNPAWDRLLARIDETIRARRQEPAADLISGLLRPGTGGRLCTDTEIAEICFAVVVGGMSTTAKLVLGALSYFGVHRADLARARADPAFLEAALEEFLRYYSPVPFLCRTATRDVTVAGRRICEGERVAFGFAAANRDGSAFQQAHDIVLDRRPNRHLALGYGIHTCIGAGLGRVESLVMVAEVLRRMPDYRIVNDFDPAADRPRMTWADRLQRGLTVTFTPGPRVAEGFHVDLDGLP